MQQTCKTCSYESPETDKFCRQCGGQFAAETEFSSATTLNHGKAEPSPPKASVGTGRFPPSIGDAIVGDTERYYSPPQYASAPLNIERTLTYAPLKPPATSRFKSFSRLMKGMFIFLLVGALLVTTGMAVFFSQEANYARRRNYELERGRAKPGAENANSRARDAWEQMEEALQLTHQAAEKAAGAGATLVVGEDKQIDLAKYAYPDAQVEAMIDSRGKEALSLVTDKDFSDVRKFYERLLGAPVLQVAVDHRSGDKLKKLLFQSPTLPSILIKIEEIRNQETDKTQVKITILHSLLRFPRFNEAQARNQR